MHRWYAKIEVQTQSNIALQPTGWNGVFWAVERATRPHLSAGLWAGYIHNLTP